MLYNYNVEPFDTNGTFSTLFKGIHKIKKHKVVIKTHYNEVSKILLENEIKIYMYLKQRKYSYSPFIKNIIREKEKLYIIMDYKSSPLSIIYKDTIDSLIHIIKSLHALNVVHRDIKPDNFLVDKNQSYIIDFGLSSFYNERPMRHLIGNKKYCSYVCHEPPYIYNYKDDLISVIYMCLHLHNGYIPWEKDYKIKTSFQHYYLRDDINVYLFTLFEQYLSES